MIGQYGSNLAIRELRKGLGLTCERFALGLGTSKSSINGFENGLRRVPLHVRSSIAKKYGGEEKNYRQPVLESDADVSDCSFEDFVYREGLTIEEFYEISTSALSNDDIDWKSFSEWRCKLAREKARNIVRHAISLLPEEDRKLLNRKYGFGCEEETLAEISVGTGVSDKGMGMRLSLIERRVGRELVRDGLVTSIDRRNWSFR